MWSFAWSRSSELCGRFFSSLVFLGLGWLILWVRTERGHQIEKGSSGNKSRGSAGVSIAACSDPGGQHHL